MSGLLLTFDVTSDLYGDTATREAFEARLAESAWGAEGVSEDGTKRTYRVELKVEGDLWDACYEYEGLAVDLRSFGGDLDMPDRPEIRAWTS
jgi:hypothetical protein